MLKINICFSKFYCGIFYTGKNDMYYCYKNKIPKVITALILIAVLFSNLQSQPLVLKGQIGEFISAEAFSISDNRFIYVTDSETNEVYKLTMSGEVTQYIGGYGWSEGAFDNPVDIFAGTLNVYVTDKNNDRIQFLDKDLNYISEFSSRRIDNPQYGFRYPTSAVISPIGDLFILDSDNSRILKFDFSGKFSLEIGSYDAGSFMLNSPIKFDISSDSRLFVLDDDEIKVFDQFGGGLNRIKIKSRAKNLHIKSDIICLTYNDSVELLDLQNPSKGFINYTIDSENILKDGFVFQDQLFILTEKMISIYNLPKN